ncbi:MAG: class I SAM-dependent methyltransferase [Kiritimatiellaeota bacterium]|nr:class I SAM-dependent methyltransferase [Kiritimatiellota bacterium]
MNTPYQPTQNQISPLRKLRRALNGLGKTHLCCVCGKRFFRFSSYRGGTKAVSSYLHTMSWISSAFDSFWCPYCRSHDRERHLILFLDALKMWDVFENATVLHVAPEKQLAFRIAARKPARYVKGDISPARSDIEKLDVTAIGYPDNTFDVIICNHVLEHVPDDTRALRELWRVLTPGGLAIFQTPYAVGLEKTREHQPEITTPEQRREFYGQEDHVRLYGRDIFDRICAAGFVSEMKTHDDCLNAMNALRYGVNPLEPFFRFRRPNSYPRSI